MFSSFVLVFCGFYEYYLRPIVKWTLRKLTGKCELLRLTIGRQKGASRTRAVEKSIRCSRRLPPLVLYTDEDCIRYLDCATKVKRIDADVYPSFSSSFIYCLRQICAYDLLLTHLESLRSTAVDWNNEGHLNLLDKLWTCLNTETTNVPIRSREWQTVGFQSDNPQQDFRGMGVLSLENLVYLSVNHTALTRSLLSASTHPQRWYPFAVVSINITEMLYTFMKEGELKNQFYNTATRCTIVDFHKLFCFVFYTFHEYWMQRTRDIMFFNHHREEFRTRLLKRLRCTDCRLGLTGSNGDVSFFEP
ncbi:unnamed protein product [Dicrocoelium dendriticum]|nr:unnamed protein product [Dicrocoelium dendriticum]